MTRIPVRGETLNLIIFVLKDIYKNNDEDFIRYLNFFFDYGIEESSLKSFETLKQIRELEERSNNGTTEQR